MYNLDERMLLAFYRFSCEHNKFRKMTYYVSHYTTYAFFAIYFGVALYLVLTRSNLVVLFIAVPLANLIISYAIRATVKRERPCTALKIHTEYETKKSYSFPSNHSASAAIIAFSCLCVNFYLGVAVFILAIFTSLSRIFLAAHYPGDVCFSFIQSVVVAIIGFSIIPVLLM